MPLVSLRNHVASALEIILRNHDESRARAIDAGWIIIDPYDDKHTEDYLRKWLASSLPDCYCL